MGELLTHLDDFVLRDDIGCLCVELKVNTALHTVRFGVALRRDMLRGCPQQVDNINRNHLGKVMIS